MLIAKLFLKDEERLFFGPGRLELLKAVRDLGSLRQAAIKLGMSYRWAWGRLDRVEKELGLPLLTRTKESVGGRPKVLTEQALELIAWLDKTEKSVLKVLADAEKSMPGFLVESLSPKNEGEQRKSVDLSAKRS